MWIPSWPLNSGPNHSLSERRHALAIFLDITKAYKTTWHHKIIQTLHSTKFRCNLFHAITNFLHNRTFQPRLGGILFSNKSLENGVPQDAVLCPILFNIAVDDILLVIPPLVRAIPLADDITLHELRLSGH